MNENDVPDLEKIEQELYRDFLSDGLTEIFMGFMLIMTAGMIEGSLLTAVYLVISVIVLPLAMKVIRERVTYPRLGYAKFRRKDEDFDIKEFVAFMVTIIAVTTVFFFIMVEDTSNTDNIYKVTPIFFGLVLIGPASMLSERSGMKIYWLFPIVATSAGILIAYLTVDNPDYDQFWGLRVLLTGLGVAVMLLGAVIFALFMRRPVLEDPEDVQEE